MPICTKPHAGIDATKIPGLSQLITKIKLDDPYAVVAVVWLGDLRLGMVFGLALSLPMGATAGMLVPLILQRLGIDPALAGGVALIAAADLVGFFRFLC